jgi:hypothetical protein
MIEQLAGRGCVALFVSRSVGLTVTRQIGSGTATREMGGGGPDGTEG